MSTTVPTTQPATPGVRSREERRALYHRLGGADGIAAIVNDIVALHLQNPIVGPRFAIADHAKLKKLATEFFCAGSGGPETYSGMDMAKAHQGMNISEQEYLAVMDDILLALQKNGIGQDEQNEVLAILWSLKGQVIRL